jgi:hypothetical protein
MIHLAASSGVKVMTTWHRRSLLVAVLAGVVFVVFVLKDNAAEKQQTRSTNPPQAAQNDCATRATQTYLRDQLALMPKPEDVPKLKFLSIETTIAKRRLEERYCLQFARCVVTDPSAPLFALQQASAFDSCLRDEALEDYDAVLRDDVPTSDDAPPRDD